MSYRNICAAAVLLFLGSLNVWGETAVKDRADRILIEKKAHIMTVYAGGKEIKRYKIAIGRGGMGKKLREGDKLTPEGLYRIDKRNPQSSYHLSLHLTYPNADDITAAAKAGVDPGSDIMIHGALNGFGWLGRFHTLFDWTLV